MRLLEQRTKPDRPPSGSNSLHFRGTVVGFGASVVLAFLTMGVCHGFLAGTHPNTPLAPVALFAIVYWLWWGCVAIGMWWLSQRWPTILTFSISSSIFHFLAACILAVVHLDILQKTVLYASRIWKNDWQSVDYFNLMRFGFELLLYGFVLGFSGLLYGQTQSHREAVRSLELEKQLSQAQLKALQMQMEPHFLFNTLNAVTSLVELGRNEEASATLAHLNMILRKTLQRTVPEKIPFAQELQVIESYLAIQQVRFADRLRVRIDTTPDALEGLVPCFLLQPIIENAIRHGISNLEGGGLLETSVERVGNMLSLRVRDNGPGLNGGSKASQGHGIGIQNTRERLSYFYPGAFDFVAGAPDTGGYEVMIRIPYERRPI